MIRYCIVLFLLITINLSSQTTIITGNAQGKPDKLVRVIVYDDLFSGLEKTIASSLTDPFGDFAFKLNIDNSQFAFLALELDKGEFYLTPGSSYRFEISSDSNLNRGSVFDRLPLMFEVFADDGGLQTSIEKFNIEYNDFIYNNVNRIYRTKDNSVVNSFIDYINENYSNDDLAYFDNYVNYTLASLKWLSRIKNNREVLQEYFINKPVLYFNIQYCDFFKEFFKSYFNSEKVFRYEDLIPVLNYSKSITPLIDLISKDTLLSKDTRVVELASMLLMSRYYYDRNVNKGSIIEKLNIISANSSFYENRKIAGNYISVLTSLESGTIAPNIELQDTYGNNISLKGYEGKFVLLAFVDNDCKMCEYHMNLINDMKDQIGFDVISVVTDKANDDLIKFAKDQKYNWPIVDLNDNILLLEDYNIRVFPTYIFINTDGTIAYVHLPMPEENMELYIKRFMNNYKAKMQ